LSGDAVDFGVGQLRQVDLHEPLSFGAFQGTYVAPIGKKPGNCPGTCPFWGGLEVSARWRNALISGN